MDLPARVSDDNLFTNEFAYIESSCMRFGIMSLPDRIRKIRRSLGLNQAEFADKLGCSQGSISRYESGGSEPGVDVLRKIAKIIGISLDELTENTVLFSSDVGKIKLVGYIGPGAAVHLFDGQEPVSLVKGFSGATAETVAVEIRGEGLGKSLDGWLAYYGAVQVEITQALIGRLCAVWLEDGRVLVRKIERGQIAGSYTLTSSYDPPIYDARIVSAAKITHMEPRD